MNLTCLRLRYLFAVVALASGFAACRADDTDLKSIETLEGLIDNLPVYDGKEPFPKVLKMLGSKDEKVAAAACRFVGKVAKRNAEDKELCEKAAFGLIRAESDKRRDVAAAAKKALPSCGTEKEIALWREKAAKEMK